MQYIDFKVQHQTITRTDKYEVVGGSQNYLHARFAFCAEWADVTVTAVFSTNSGKHISVIVEDGECLVPWEMLTGAEFWVGVFGGDRLTTSTARVPVKPGVKLNASPGVQPTPSAYEMLVGKAVTSAAAAKISEDNAAASETAAKISEENAAASEETAVASAAAAERAAERAEEVETILNNTAVGGVYNVVVADRYTGDRYALIAENGGIFLLGVDETVTCSEVSLVNNSTGAVYQLAVENGNIILEEV